MREAQRQRQLPLNNSVCVYNWSAEADEDYVREETHLWKVWSHLQRKKQGGGVMDEDFRQDGWL